MLLRHSYDAHFGLEGDAVQALDGGAHVSDEVFHVRRARLPVVDDEIRVLGRDRGVADAKALQPRRLDQARGVIARGIGEHRAAAPLPDRLRGLAAREERAHLARMGTGALLKLQACADEPFLRHRRRHVAVAHLVLVALARVRGAAAVDGLDALDVAPGLPAEGTGVHGERPAEGARDTGKELGGPQAPLDALAGDARAGDAGFGAHRGVVHALEGLKGAVRADDDAADAPIAHQQVAAQTNPLDRHPGGHAAQERGKLGAIGGIEEYVRRPADMPGSVAAQGLIAAHAGDEFGRDGHAHEALPGGSSADSASGNACATALMLPAPMARMTSPSLITSFRAWGSSSTFSTNSGSSSPRLRTARQMARPSAPAIGASPAAYTSVTHSTSAPESALPKSSMRSRVRVKRCGWNASRTRRPA